MFKPFKSLKLMSYVEEWLTKTHAITRDTRQRLEHERKFYYLLIIKYNFNCIFEKNKYFTARAPFIVVGLKHYTSNGV